MGAFYRTDYSGIMGSYQGAIAIVNGKIAGLDTGDGRIIGTYVEREGKLVGSITVSVPGGGTLVGGSQVGASGGLTVPLEVPLSALDGHIFTLNVGGPIKVKLTKIADL